MRSFIVLLSVLFISSMTNAQLSISLNFNVDNQPAWGPTGYDYVEYYYMPDIEVYYYVPQRRFYFFEGGRWMSGTSLPHRYRGFDLYSSYKVVVNDRTPYRRHDTYRERYSSYKGRRDQAFIRDSRDSRYYSNKNHPEHNNWSKNKKDGRGDNKKKDEKRPRK